MFTVSIPEDQKQLVKSICKELVSFGSACRNMWQGSRKKGALKWVVPLVIFGKQLSLHTKLYQLILTLRELLRACQY